MNDPAYWLLPEGIEETLPPAAAQLERVRRELLDMYRVWGYELVIPPLIEYLESLLTGAGRELDLETFKLTDQLNGRLMGVRADITPQVARIDAHRLHREVPVRLCYMARVLRTRPQGLGGTRSPLQVGAELYGHAGIDSDVEIIRLMLATLKACGIGRVHVDLGHIDIFRCLVEAARLEPEIETELFELLQRKAVAEMSEQLAASGLGEIHRRRFLDLANLNGGAEVLLQARERFAGVDARIDAALDYLDDVAAAIRHEAPDVELCFDLGELRGYHYHSGLVYAAYVPGRGQELARGGRYDGIGKAFGRARPATGFSADLEGLLEAGAREDIAATARIYAPAEGNAALDDEIRRLRDEGRIVIRALCGQQGDARAMGCDQILVRHGDQWLLTEVN
ncbi:ATP phosphoribosyltransferase regulatory subunit [Acidihalobacter yilgarnensis]|uniref:ATP phosphoribosyltransferase regulatory subunit n=1 Tax=Acidihalobacter yilgarnensis TaxID=2819280 RepID=A0A1D8ILN3_9GAMM|nr:ATP phosphoribosyltransferase regulatory subunit [Acidihalobacter yilgarnensis]AOU97376.1 ATP phosphoribosyltransferase regulatory subunit [Acidihalobacter yilgarnensis]